MSLWKGSAIERAAVNGNRFGTPLPSCSPNTALFIGVPSAPTMAKILSLLMSLLAACTARGTWYWWSSTIELDLAAVDALLVGLLEAHAHAFGGADAPCADRTAQRGVAAEHDLGIGDAVLGRAGSGKRAGEQRTPIASLDSFLIFNLLHSFSAELSY